MYLIFSLKSSKIYLGKIAIRGHFDHLFCKKPGFLQKNTQTDKQSINGLIQSFQGLRSLQLYSVISNSRKALKTEVFPQVAGSTSACPRETPGSQGASEDKENLTCAWSGNWKWLLLGAQLEH